MTWDKKYQIRCRDRHNILWTSDIEEENFVTFAVKYGNLYNWYAAIDERLICAEGWHIPTSSDFNTLLTYAGASAKEALRESGLVYWSDPNAGTNTLAFNMRGSGGRYDNNGTESPFFGLQEFCYFLCSDLDNNNNPYTLQYYKGDDVLSVVAIDYSGSGGDDTKNCAASLRPVKDSTTLTHGQTGTYTGNDGKVYRTICIGNQEWLADNLAETKYRDGSDIPIVTDNTAWAALTTGAMCAYDNDDDNAYTGTPGAMTSLIGASTEPLVFEHVNESDDIFDPIKSIRAILTVWSYQMFGLASLYSVEEMYHRVKTYQQAALYFQGFVDPKQYSEDYGPIPYQTKIYAVDGLTLLKNIKYEVSDGVPYEGHKLESEIILDILGKIGHTTFTEFVNLYATGMNSDVTDSPMDQLKINTDVFADMYCDDVLKEILKKYNANIRQVAGVFVIFRPTELTGATVYGRIFTSPTSKTGTSITPLQYIDRDGYDSPLRQVQPSSVGGVAPAKKVICYQDYGNQDSWVENWDMKGNTYDEDTLSYQNWTCPLVLASMNSHFPDEFDGIALPGNVNGDYYIEQVFGLYAKATDEVLPFSFEFIFQNNGTTQQNGVDLYIEVRAVNANRWLYEIDENEVGWKNVPDYIYIERDIPKGKGLWESYTRKILTGLPVDGPYRIRMYCANNVNIITGYKNVRIFSTSDKIVVKRRPHHGPFAGLARLILGTPKYVKQYIDSKEIVEREYSAVNSIEGEVLEYNYMLGDVADTEIENVVEQFAGALVLSERETLTDAATTFVSEQAAVFSDIDLSSSGADIIFTEDESGDFSGASTIVNTEGDLSGTVVTTQAHVEGTKQINKITLSGTEGLAYISCNGVSRMAEFVTSLSETAIAFCAAYLGDFLAAGVDITADGNDVVFTEHIAEGGFTYDPTINNEQGDLSGSETAVQSPVAGVKRIDTITLTGSYGKATITVDGHAVEIEIPETLTPTTTWNRRRQFENLPLLQIIANEIAYYKSKPRQFVDMAIWEMDKVISSTNLVGIFKDSINTVNTYMRAFFMNRGTFYVKSRAWRMDLFELDAPVSAQGGSGSTTADSTTVTADSTTVTADIN